MSTFGHETSEEQRHSNAWTNRFSTGYWLKATEHDLDNALSSLTELAKPLSVDREFALQERNIIQREYDYRVAEWPFYKAHREIARALYGNGTLARSVIGTPHEIAQYDLDRAMTLHQQSHILSTATLLIYGNTNKRRVENALGRLEAKEDLFTIPTEKHWVENAKVLDSQNLKIPNISEDVFIYSKVIKLNDSDDTLRQKLLIKFAENVIDSTRPEGIAGPLRFEQFIARSFSFDLENIGNEYVKIYFSASPDDGSTSDDIETVFHTALSKTLSQGISTETFDRVHARLSNQFTSILPRDRAKVNRDLILEQLQYAEPIYALSEQEGALKDITLADVNAFLKFLSSEGREVTRKITKADNL